MYYDTFKEYKIEIINEEDYTADSADNRFEYGLTYQHPEDETYRHTSKHGIKVYKDGLYKSAILLATGGCTGVNSYSALTDDENLLICCSNKVFSLRLPDLELNWITQADMATCFGIFQYKDSYIIHGEVCISRISRDGKIEWTQGARDIFVSIDNAGDTFKMHDDHIELMDWGRFRYKLFYDGSIIDDGVNPTGAP
jgi:hypothetical protein